MKVASIKARSVAIEAEISQLKSRLEEATGTLENPAASDTVKQHIKLLHDYNDIRDVGQGLIGMIADGRGIRVGELYEEFGVDLKD
jgi:DNA repair protein Swi5/Sae3